MNKLVLFIHGLGGTADSTWQKFPALIRADTELTELYDVETFEYDTGAVGSKPSLATCAVILKTEIENRYPDYSDIALIAHSQGGLVARYYIAERINSAEPLRVSRLLTFATPHQGSGFATLLKHVPYTSQEIEDLDPNSEFMRALAVAWGQANADRRVLTKYVVAAGDAIVGHVSAMGPWSRGYEVVGGDGHLAVVKPETSAATSFLIAKKFLLEDSLVPGGVEADYQAPLLRFNRVEPVEINRFIYSARALPFIGRDADITILADFLGSPEQPFRWMVMHGSGGVGKSRLALELCLAIRNEWHAGFLSQEEQEPDWGRWQPLMPTLIVIDYASRDTERIGKLLRALAGRGPADGTLRLVAPVRVLLVERTGEGDWLNKIVGVGTTKARVNAAHAINLLLATISDPWPIFEFVLNKVGRPLPDKAETLAALGKIDPERRPLFAYFMADAIAAGHDVHHFDAARLLDQVIDRGREAYWKPAGATAKEERLLAVATMAGGLPVSALTQVTEKLLPSWDVDRHPKVFLAMTGRESGENIASLEPDIVGEHFALACLAQNNFSNEDRARLCELAWRLNPPSMAAFMMRVHFDLPNHPMLHWVRKSPDFKGHPQFWWAGTSVDLMTVLSMRGGGGMRSLLDDLRGVAGHRDDAEIWLFWAKAAVNAMLFLSLMKDPSAGLALLDDMHDVANRRDEPLLWQAWAKAAYKMINGITLRANSAKATLLSGDPQGVMIAHDMALDREMLVVVNDLRAVAATRDAAVFWKMWAGAARALTVYISFDDPGTARDLLDDMRDVAKNKRDEAYLWQDWAQAAVNLTFRFTWGGDPNAARALLDDLRDVAGHRDDAHLWYFWVYATAKVMIYLISSDWNAAQALLDDIRVVAAEHDEAPLWDMWDLAAHFLMEYVQLLDPVTAQTVFANILTLPPDLLQRLPQDILQRLRLDGSPVSGYGA